MRKILLLVLLLGGTYMVALAQERAISGTVVDQNGEPIPGVNVVIKGTTTGTTTDLSGNYRLNVNEGDMTLVFSFIGMNTQEVEIGSRSVIDLEMTDDVQQLSEVVVTAFGIEREKKALSYSVQDVDGKRISDAGTPNAVNALQGKIAGVQINQSSGMPGASSFIRIRGSNSFSSNNQPLFVVDGTPIASNPNATFTGGVSGTDNSSRALDINPEDIESISVLKGASAAALYGLRASNGVVIITTKSGRNLKKGTTQVSFSQSVTVDEVTRIPDVQDTWAQGTGGLFSQTSSTSWGPRIDQLGDPAFNPFATGDGNTYINNVGEEVLPQKYDNINPMFENGITSVSNMNILGRTQSGSFALNLGYTTQSGVIPTTGMNRFNAKLSGDHNISDKLTIGGTINVINTDIDKLAGGSNISNVLFTTYWAPRSYDLWGTPFAQEDDPFSQIHYRGAMDNPRWSLKNNSFNENIKRALGNASISYRPTSYLSFNYKLGYDTYTEVRKEVYGLGSGFTGGRTAVPSGGQIDDFTRTYLQLNSNFTVGFNKQFGQDFVVDAIAGNEIVEIRINDQQQTGTGITIGGFDNISNTTNQVTSSTVQNSRTVGFYANASLAWRETLFLNAGGRQDYTSVMPRGNRSFFYPSVGLGFVVSEIAGLADNNVLSFAKVRGSYAEVGQAAIGPHSTQLVFLQSAVGSGFTNNGIAFPFAGQTGFQQSNILRNPNLRPQNTTQIEAGIEMNFFLNRIGFDVAYFIENTTDQIFTVPIPATTGYSSELRNGGELENTGWEVTLNASPLRNPNGLSWDISANFTSVQSEVISLAPGVENIFLGGFVTPNVRASASGSYPVIFGSRFLRDDNGDIVYDSRQFVNGVANPSFGMPITDPENGVIGKVNPDFEIGISSTLSYKGLSLGVHVDIREGAEAYAGNTRLQKLYGQDIVTEDRTTPVVPKGVKGYLDNDGNLIVEGENDIAIVRGERYWNVEMDNIDESNVYSTDFLRLREVNLSYTLPPGILSNTIFKSASVYVMARNLLLITDYPNFDPETSVGGAGNFQGLEYVNLPQTRSFGGGIRVNF